MRYLRWEAKKVSTLEQFEKTIEPMWEIAQNKGGNYSNALAVILMEIIKNCTDQIVKQRACKGDGHYKLGLTHLITIEKVGEWKNSVSHLTDYFPEKFNQKDRFWETRQIVTQYFFRLATKPKYKDFGECSRTALINRLTDLGSGNKEKRSKERERLHKRLLENQDLRNELEPKMGKLYGEVEEAKRGASTEEDLEKEYDALTLKEEEFAKKISEIEIEIQALEDPGFLTDIDNEEKSLLASLLDTIDK